MNNVALVGRLVRDPDIRYTANDQMAITRFTIAVNRRFKKEGQPDADFIGCVCFGKTGENVAKYCKKGYMVSVGGNIRTGSYEKDGKKVYTTDVVAEEVTFLDRGSDKGRNTSDDNGSTSNFQSGSGDFTPPIEDDDLPF